MSYPKDRQISNAGKGSVKPAPKYVKEAGKESYKPKRAGK